MASISSEPTILFSSEQDWEKWLSENHAGSAGLWLKLAKKGSRIESVSYADALEVAICFGWIDGQKRPLDECFWLQRFTPRRPRGRWSRVNRERAERLIEVERMRAPGLVEVERAKADGRWDAAYAPQSRIEVPEDLRVELERRPEAARFFAGLDSANRYAILYRIEEAERADTRARRIEKYLAMLEAGEKLHP